MTVAILVLTIFVTVYGVNTFYERPNYEDFCEGLKLPELVEDAETCDSLNGKWSDIEGIRPVESEFKGYCDLNYYCRQDFEAAREKYSFNTFLIVIPLGIAIIILGAFLFSLESVGAGLMGGGVGTLLFGVGGYWRYATNWVRFVVSLLGLVFLIWVTYYFNNLPKIKKKRKKKK